MKGKRTTYLLIAIVLLIVVELSLWLAIKKHYLGSSNRYLKIHQSNFLSREFKTFYCYDASYTLKFISEVKDIINGPIDEFTIEKANTIREALLNIGSIKNESVEGGPIELLKGLREGKTLSCWNLSLLYGFMLNSAGFNVRHIAVSRSLFDLWDSHTITEVWDEKKIKWIISDPTFNVSFKKNDKYLSSDELYDLIHSGGYISIKVIRGKATKYEYSLEKYYISYFSLFDNLLYVSHINLKGGIMKYPPLRWFDDRFAVKLIGTDKHPVRGNEIHIQNTLMFFMLFLIPLTIIASFILYCLSNMKRNNIFKRLFTK